MADPITPVLNEMMYVLLSLHAVKSLETDRIVRFLNRSAYSSRRLLRKASIRGDVR